MMLSDEVVAVFQSSFEHGDVRLVYCPLIGGCMSCVMRY